VTEASAPIKATAPSAAHATRPLLYFCRRTRIVTPLPCDWDLDAAAAGPSAGQQSGLTRRLLLIWDSRKAGEQYAEYPSPF
jgi:hypothetical protein